MDVFQAWTVASSVFKLAFLDEVNLSQMHVIVGQVKKTVLQIVGTAWEAFWFFVLLRIS